MTRNAHPIYYDAEKRVFGQDIQTVLGRLLYEERWRRRWGLEKVSSKLQMKAAKIENVELARGHIHIGRIQRLLELYEKEVVISLKCVEKAVEE